MSRFKRRMTAPLNENCSIKILEIKQILEIKEQ